MDNEKKGTGKTIAIIVLVLLILGLGGYIAYDKMLSKKTSETIETTKTKSVINEGKKDFDINNKKMVQVLEGSYSDEFGYEVYISNKGEAFLTVNSFDNSTNEDVKNNISIIKKQYQLNKIDGYCNINGEPVNDNNDICPNNGAIESIKLDVDDVVAAYEGYNGQGDTSGLYVYFVKTDGTISGLEIGNAIYADGKLNIKNNIGGLKNIVSIASSRTTGLPSGYYYAMAIEKDGTQHDLANNNS